MEKEKLKLESWEEADEAGGRILGIEAALEQLEGQRKALKLAVDEDIGSRTGPLKEEQGPLLDAIFAWFRSHPKDRDEGTKQKTLNKCVLSEKVTPGFKYPSPLSKLVEKLKRLGFDGYIRVKEEPDKSMIERAPDDDLEAMGVTKTETTTVYVKPAGS